MEAQGILISEEYRDIFKQRFNPISAKLDSESSVPENKSENELPAPPDSNVPHGADGSYPETNGVRPDVDNTKNNEAPVLERLQNDSSSPASPEEAQELVTPEVASPNPAESSIALDNDATTVVEDEAGADEASDEKEEELETLIGAEFGSSNEKPKEEKAPEKPKIEPEIRQEVEKGVKDAIVEFYKQSFNATDVSSVDEVFEEVGQLYDAVTHLQEELESAKSAQIPEDPAIKELISLYRANNSVEDIIEGLKLLNDDPSAVTDAGIHKVSNEDLIRRWLSSDGDMGEDEIETWIETQKDTDPIGFKLKAKDLRKTYAEEHASKFERLRQIKEGAKDRVELDSQESQEAIRAQKEFLETARQNIEKVSKIRGKEVNPQAMQPAYRVALNALADNSFIQDIFTKPDGSPDWDKYAEVYLLYSNKIPERVRQRLYKIDMPNVSAIEKEARRRFAEERINVVDKSNRDRTRSDSVAQRTTSDVRESIIQAAQGGKLIIGN